MSSKNTIESHLHKNNAALPKNIQDLMNAAERQLSMSYAPYSNFHVGAAVLLENGNIYLGCNQENASYPLCMCAERVALYNMGAQEKDFNILAIAITAHNPAKALKEPVMPCGACRQVIQEFESRQTAPIALYLTSDCEEIMQIVGIEKILPFSFSKEHLI